MFEPSRARPFALAGALSLMAACGPAEAPKGGESPDVPPATTVVGPDTVDAVVAAARPAAGALMQALSVRLRTAIEEEGVVGAMEFCNVEALPLTARVESDQGLSVKRTSLRLRNPGNAPDPAEAEALSWYAEQLASGAALPEYHVQRLAEGGYRYYQPLVTGEFCLQCHGTAGALAPGVAEALVRLYPEDQATGYEAGEWRGLLRVTVPEGAVAGR